ncbi:MlaA family lipoprotein [Noviherbaspirillum massiliense]|uniref:MlaA family lipoprotein n=1 Tax=Noviherbaspirillum massiliense TaxID=1465823 RepID=UPI001375CD2C|nr:VacJ family lipoprotein [Noviherbaspirillum massiliense]
MYRTQRPRTTKSIPALAMSIAVLSAVSGCATGPDSNPNDPLELLNRKTFQFNDAVDQRVAIPIAKRYNEYVPGPARTAVSNFFSNIGDVTVMANNFAQGRGADGLSDMMRILTNTFFGIGGLIDIATPAGLPKHDQDFGLTLGHWGVPAGPYLVLPLFGPSSFRDSAGFAADQQINPTNYVEGGPRYGLWGTNFVSTRARYLGVTNLLEAAALDKYSFVRDAYLARRKSRVNEGKEESLPNYDGEEVPADKGTDEKNPAGEAGTKGAPPQLGPATGQ